MDFIRKLQSRRLLKDHTKSLESFPSKGIYCGFDPTAASLHLGHMCALNSLVLASSLGYSPIAIIGTSTALIGDPSGKTESRPIIQDSFVSSNATSLYHQIHKIVQNLQLKLNSQSKPLQVIHNHTFYQDLNLISFLRDFGYFFQMNPLINRDFVSQRKDGVTFTEFTYGLLQAYDFYKLFNDFDCVGQFGGSDQWSNIISGTELIRKKLGKPSFGCTLPLLTTKDGKKFGKTEGNALFLDRNLTKPYEIYQYCFNQPDDLIESLLFRLTFIGEDEIAEIFKGPLESRAGQKRLGFDLIETLHGRETAVNTERITEILFSEKYSELNSADIGTLSEFAQKVDLKQEVVEMSVLQALKELKLTSGNKESRNLIKMKSIKFNGEALGEDSALSDLKFINNQFGILTVGRKNLYLLLKPSNN